MIEDRADLRPSYTRWQLISYALRLGSIGFGGPVSLVGYMNRDLAERRKWISESDLKEGFTIAQLMPRAARGSVSDLSWVRARSGLH